MTDAPLPVTLSPAPRGAGSPAWVGNKVTARMGNNAVHATVGNTSRNTNNIANSGGGGGGRRSDPTTTLLLAALLANRQQPQAPPPMPAVAPGPIFLGPNPYAIPPGYVNPNTPVPTQAPPPTLDPTLLQQLMAPATPAPQSADLPGAMVSGGVSCCLVCFGIAWMVWKRRKSA